MAVPRGLLAVVGGALSGVGAGMREEQKQKQAEQERQAKFLMQQRLEELRHEFALRQAEAEHGFRIAEQEDRQTFEADQSEKERAFEIWKSRSGGEKENTVQYSSVQDGKLVIVYRDGKREIIDIGEPQKKDAAKVKTTAVDKDGHVWLINEDGTMFRTPIQTATATNKEFRQAVETAIKSAKRPDLEGGGVDWETATRILEEMGFGDKARAIFQPRVREQVEQRARQRAEELWRIQEPGALERIWGTIFGSSNAGKPTFDELYQRILAEELAAAGLSEPQARARGQTPAGGNAPSTAPQQASPRETPPAMDVSRLPEGAVVEDDGGRVWQKQGGRFVRRPDLDDRVKPPQEQPARRAL